MRAVRWVCFFRICPFTWNSVISILFCTFLFGGLVCVDPSFAYVAHLWFFSNVWIRTQRAAVASRRATNLATHLPASTNLATHLPTNLATHLPLFCIFSFYYVIQHCFMCRPTDLAFYCRIEKFYAFWGQDLDSHTTPMECGRGFRCKMKSDIPFIGRILLSYYSHWSL